MALGAPGTGPAPRAVAVAATLARDVARLVVPVECPGCGRRDVPLCPGCAASVTGPPRRCEDAVPRLDRMDGRPVPPVWALAAYAGPVRGMVVAWKDRGRADLTGSFVAAAERGGARLAPVLGPMLAEVAVLGGLRLVPVPTTAAARRRRGADLVRLLADGWAAGLRGAGVPAVVAPVLQRRRRADQVGLGARARARNVAGSVRVRSGPVRGVVVLVDDVVTTGSTLAACRGALERAGALVVGGVVLAATPPPSGRQRPAAGGSVTDARPR